MLVGYQVLWMFNPWNGPGGPWAMGNENIGSAFDIWLLGRHYAGYYVGMNAIPSSATIIFGVMAGEHILGSAIRDGRPDAAAGGSARSSSGWP